MSVRASKSSNIFMGISEAMCMLRAMCVLRRAEDPKVSSPSDLEALQEQEIKTMLEP